MNGLEICGKRLLGTLDELASFGARPDGGVDRVAGSPEDLASRRWLADYLLSCGLESEIDDVGNVFGQAPDGRGPWLLAGSHSDTVPAGGRLDGAYGVMAAIEVLCTLHEQRHPAANGLRVVSFWDEEGAQPQSSGGMVGSSAFTGSPRISSVGAFIELHVEQGARMESSAMELCVVDGIVGVDRYLVTMTGEANHAGTTPFAARHDAGRALARAAASVQDLVSAEDDAMIGNVGHIQFDPGAANVVPGRAHMTVELRAPSEELLLRSINSIITRARAIAAQERCTMDCRQLSHKPVVCFDAGMRRLLHEVCAQTGRPCCHLLSYAGHDAGVVGSYVPTAMLFVPSANGISHAPGEKTPDHLLVQGAQALLDAVVRYASA